MLFLYIVIHVLPTMASITVRFVGNAINHLLIHNINVKCSLQLLDKKLLRICNVYYIVLLREDIVLYLPLTANSFHFIYIIQK